MIQFRIGLAFVLLSCALVHADEANWVDRYIEAHGACEQPLIVYQPQPLGLPIQEWTEGDLAKLKSAIAKCEAKSQNERGIPLGWGQAVLEAVQNDVREHRRIEAQRTAMIEARRAQAVQADLARHRQLEKQEQARNAEADAALAARRAADARAAQALAEQQEKDRVREQKRLAAVQDQARRNRGAADRTKALADQEASRIREIEREASDAQSARIEAERRLDEVRKRARHAEEQRNSEDEAIGAANGKRVQTEKQLADRQREKREFEALAKTCAVSAEQFGRIALGMRLRDVQKAFGCVGSLDTSSEVEGLGVLSIYRWEGAKSGTAAVTTFNNDALVSKSQTALD